MPNRALSPGLLNNRCTAEMRPALQHVSQQLVEISNIIDVAAGITVDGEANGVAEGNPPTFAVVITPGTNVGDYALYFTLGIPVGATGATGATGAQGPQGDPGEVEEAPEDDKYYGRVNATWAEVPEESPNDGDYYVRQRTGGTGGWIPFDTVFAGAFPGGLSDTILFTDADGNGHEVVIDQGCIQTWTITPP